MTSDLDPSERREPTDTELVEQCMRGSERAWKLLVTRYQKLVYAVCLRSGLHADDADDVFVESFLRLSRCLPSLRDRSQVRSWLITTARRASIDALRLARRDLELAAGAAPPEPPPSPEQDFERLEERYLVQLALSEIDHRCRELLEALYLGDEGVSYGEVSRSLGIPVGSIGPTRARCLDKLRRTYDRLGHRTLEERKS